MDFLNSDPVEGKVDLGRRSFLRGILAVPLAAALSKCVPEPVPTSTLPAVDMSRDISICWSGSPENILSVHPVSVWKYGRSIEVSYERLRRQPTFSVQAQVDRMVQQMRQEELKAALEMIRG